MSKQEFSETSISSISKSLLDDLAIPVVVGKGRYDEEGKLIDIVVVFVNKQHLEQTHNFLKIGDSYSTLVKILPKGVDWFGICDKTIRTGEPYETDYFTSRINTWFHLIIKRYDKDLCVFTINNVTSEKQKESHLKYLESNDTNTGLANCKRFNEMLESAMQDAQEKNTMLGLALIDIDNLRTINDLSGRDVGNEIINATANVLERFESDNVHAFRLDGDEFALLMIAPESEDSMKELCEKVYVKLASQNLGISMGIALYPSYASTIHTLFRDADLALHFIKDNGKGNFKYFETHMYNEFLNRIEIQKRIFQGLERDEFFLYYQPQFYLGGHTLRGFEALVRWDDGENGMQLPTSFIPIAEESNAIQVLGEWILDTAIKTLKHWQDDFHFDGIMSINISPIQLKSPLFITTLERIIEKNKIKPESLELEITESVFISDIEKTTALLNKIRSFGIRLSLDDFGTGYSSLRYLANMPINTLKLDKSFIDCINDSDNLNNDIISSIIPVTKKAGMETIAEGVEHPEQISALDGMKCNCIQGFLWGKPMPLSRCDAFLQGDQTALDTLK